MPNFVFAFHGGTMPATPEETATVMAKWGAWFSDLGDAIVTPGAPLGASTVVSAGGSSKDDVPSPMTGYTVVSADSMDAALELAKGCPSLENGGAVKVSEEMKM